MKIYFKGMKAIAIGAALAPLSAYAQTDATVVTEIENAHTHIALAIIVGIGLAFAFQLLLTGLSVATGLSLTPDLRKVAAKAKASSLAAGHPLEEVDEETHLQRHRASSHLVNEFGVWALGTTSIALFLATWLSLRLSFLNVPEHRYIAGVAIWAGFLMITTWFEWKAAKSVLGVLVNVAAAGFHTGTSVLHGLIAKSPAKQLEDVTQHTLHSIYRDLRHAARKHDVEGAITRYVSQLKPDGLDYDRIHDELAALLSQAKELNPNDISADKLNRVLKKKLEDRHPLITGENITRLAATIALAVKSAREGNRGSDKVFGIVDAFLPLPEGQSKELRGKIEEYLARTHRDELDPEAIRADIEKIVDDPGSAKDIVLARLSHFDRGTLKAVLAQHGIDEQRTDQVIERTLAAVNKVKGKYADASGAAQQKLHDLQGQAGNLPQTAEAIINDYLDRLDVPGLNLGKIRTDIEDVLHSLGETPQILRDRLADLHDKSILEIVQNNPFVSPEQVQKIADQIAGARDKFATNLLAIEDRAVALYENARRRAVIAAEHARKASVTASWWLVGTALFGLGFALFGAYFSQMLL